MKSITYSNQVPRSTVLRRLGKSGLLRKLVGSSVAAFFAMGSIAPFAHAGQVWDGGNGTGNWTDGANWNVDNLVPNFGLGINFAGAVQNLTNINGATAVTNGITFDAGGGAFTINSAAGITNSGNITNNSASSQIFGVNITVGSPQIWQTAGGAGSLSFNNPVVLNNTLTTTANGASIIIAGAVSGGSGITHTVGTLNLNAANLFTGPLQVNGGSVTTVANGLADAVAVTVDGGTWTPGGADTIARLAGGAGGTVNLGANTITTGDANNTAFLGAVNGVGGGLTKQGTGAFTLSGNNGYTGATLINAGTVILGNDNALGTTAGATTVAANAALDLGGRSIAFAENITLNGAGIAGAGALINSGAAASSAGSVTLGSASTIGVAGNSITLTGVISGNNNLTKVGPGTLTFQGGGANTNTATTTVNQGFLRLNKAGVAAIAGPLVIGDNLPGAASVVLDIANQIVDTQNVMINSDGNFNRNGLNEGINTLTLTANGATVTGGGNVTVNGTLTMTSGNLSGSNTTLGNTGGVPANIIATGTGALGANPATIADSLTLTLANHNITVNPGTAVNPTPDLNVTGQITGAGGFTKLGTGIMQVTTANNYNGATVISDGLFVIPAGVANALGVVNAAPNDTTVNGTGTMLLLNGATTGAENITTNTNTGFNNLGAIATVPNGTGTVGGLVTLTADSAMQTNGNNAVINLNGGVSKVDLNLTLTHIGGGTGTFNVNAPITGGNFGPGNFNDDLIVNGVTSNLNAANTYLGPTIITSIVANDGIVNANVANALPTLNGRTAVRMDAAGAGGSTLNISGIVPAFPLGANQSVASLTGVASSKVTLGGNILTIGFGTGVNVNGDPAAVFAGTISGNTVGNSLIKDDTSTQILTGANNYVGNTVITNGTLQVGNGATAGSALGFGIVTVQPLGTLAINLADGGTFAQTVQTTGATATVAGINNLASGTQTINSFITGPGNFVQNQGGTSVFANGNNYQGGTTITAVSNVTVGNVISAGLAGTGGVVINNASTLQLVNVLGGILPNAISGTAGTGTVLQQGSNQTITLSGAVTTAGITVTQNSVGTLILSNAGNNYGGVTSITNTGTLQIGTVALPGSIGAAAVGVNAGGTLALVNLNGNALANDISNGATATSGTVLINSVNNNTLAGNITNAGGGLINVTQLGVGTTILNGAANNIGGVITISAGTLQFGSAGNNGLIGVANNNIINNAALVFDGAANTYGNLISGTGTVTKNQNNVTQLGGNNTYTGITTVNAGTLQMNSATALGSTNAGTIVANGATLNLNGQNVGAEAVQLGDAGGGATLSNAAGAAASLLGPVTLANNSTVNTVTAADDITLDGVVSGNFGLTKNGAGTLVLNAINSYSGVTQINTGTVQLGNASALGSISGNTVVANGASLNLNGQNIGLEGLSLAGPGNGDLATVGVLQNSNAAPAVVGGPVLLAAASTIGTHAGAITIDGVISGAVGANLTKVGVGTLIQNGVNTYNGQTLIQQGILVAGNNAALGSLVNGTTVTAGASLQLGAVTIGAEALNINGAGPANATGAITQSPGVTSTYGGLITLQSDSTINTNAGSTLNLNGGVTKTDLFLTINGGGTVNVGVLNGGQLGITGDDDNLFNDDLIVDNATTLNLNVANTYEGPTFIRNGSTVNANGANALPTAAGRTRIEMDQAAGNLVLGANQSIASLNSVNVGSTMNLNANTLTIGFTTAPNINGNAVANFTGVISGAGNIIKDDTSNQTLSGVNTYAGTTSVNAGTLTVGNNSALGTIAGNTSVTAGATLDLNGFNIGLEPLSLAGVGVGGNGALQNNNAGPAAAGGLVTLTANTTVGANTGNITLSGAISGAFALTKIGAQTLTLSGANTYTGDTTVNAGILQLQGGAAIADTVAVILNLPGSLELVNNNNETIGSLSGNGNVNLNANTLITGDANNTIHAGIISGTGGLTKQGNGTFTVNGANTYGGATNINAGTFIAGNPTALGAVGTGTTVANGATLQLNGVIIGAEALNLTGTGVGGNGALTQTAGTGSTYGGNITLGGVAGTNTMISSNGAGTLTLNGTINKTDVTLTFTGGGVITLNGSITGGNFGNFNDDLTVNGVTANLNAANTYLGPTFITSTVTGGGVGTGNGILNATAPNALPTANGRTAVQMDGGTLGGTGTGGSVLNLVNVGHAVASLTGVGGANAALINLNANTLTIGFGTALNSNGTANADFRGNINGAGNIIKDDISTQIFSGTNGYTGTTTVNDGTLVENGTHNNAGNYFIGNNAVGADILAGTGTINLAAASSVNLLAGSPAFLSTLSVGDPTVVPVPVASILTISNLGNVAINMAVGSTLNVDLFTGAGLGNNTGILAFSDRLNLTGTLVSGANAGVLVVGNPLGLTGFRGGDSWLLVNMAPAGGPGNITGNLGVDNPGVFDGLNDTALNLVPTQVGNFNQVSGVYTVIDTITGLQMANIMGQSVMSAAQCMLGDVNGRLFFLRSGYGERGYDGSLSASLDAGVESGEGDMVGSDSGEWQAYLNANYNNVSIDAVGAQQAGFDSDTWTAGVGFERSISPNFTLGFAANWLESQQDFSNNVGKLDMSGISLSAYGSYVRKAFWADMLYSFGSFDIETNRNTIGFGNANGQTDAMTHAVQFNTGWNFRFQDNSLVTGPIVGVDYMHATVDGFSETGGGLAALRYNSRNYDSLISRVGWSLSKKVDTDFAKITAQVRLSYERQNIKHDNQTSVSLINQPFTPNSAEQNLGQDYMGAGAGLNFQFTPRFGVLLNYQGQFFRQSVQAHFVNIRAGFSF